MSRNKFFLDVDKGFRRIFQKFLTSTKFEARAGVVGPRARKEVKGDGEEKKKPLNVAAVAQVLEFGTRAGVKPKIPSRPFLRKPFDENKKKYLRTVQRAAKKTEDGLTGAMMGMTLAANQYTGHVIKAINARRYKKLADATIERRRSGFIKTKGGAKRKRRTKVKDDLPLINTGQMIGSIGVTIKNQTNYTKGRR